MTPRMWLALAVVAAADAADLSAAAAGQPRSVLSQLQDFRKKRDELSSTELQLRQLGPAKASSLAEVLAQRSGHQDVEMVLKCKTDCKQDKEINKLKSNQADAVKRFTSGLKKHNGIIEQLNATNLMVEIALMSVTDRANKTGRAWKSLNAKFRKEIGDFKKETMKKFTATGKGIARDRQSIDAFFNYIKPKFVQMGDKIMQNRELTQSYVKSESKGVQQQQSMLDAAVKRMGSKLAGAIKLQHNSLNGLLKSKTDYDMGRIEGVQSTLNNAKASVQKKYEDNDMVKYVEQQMAATNANLITFINKGEMTADAAKQTGDKLLGGELKRLTDEGNKFQKKTEDNLETLYGSLSGAAEQQGIDVMSMREEVETGLESGVGKMETDAKVTSTVLNSEQQSIMDYLKANGMDIAELRAIVNAYTSQASSALKELRNGQEENSELGESVYAALKSKWTTDFMDLSETVDTQVDKVGTAFAVQLEMVGELGEAAKEELAANLNALHAASDMDLSGLQNKLEDAFNNIFTKFEGESDTLAQAEKHLEALGISKDMTDAERAMIVAGMDNAISDGTQAQIKQSKKMAAKLLTSLRDAAEYTESENADAAKSAAAQTEMMRSKFASYQKKLESTTDRAMAGALTKTSMLMESFSLNNEITRKKQAAATAERDKLVMAVGTLAESGARAATEIADSAKAASDRVSAARGKLGSKLSSRIAKAKSEVADDMAEKARLAALEIDKAGKGVEDGIEHGAERLTALEMAMKQGAIGFETHAQRMEGNKRNLQKASEQLNAEISQDFQAAQAMLSKGQLAQADSVEKVQDILTQRKEALEDLLSSRVAGMKEEHKNAFDAAVAKRQQAIDAILANKALSVDEVKELIAKAEAEMAETLQGLEQEAMLSEDEVEEIHKSMEGAVNNVNLVMQETANQINMTQLLVMSDAESQKQYLKERSAKVLKSLEGTIEGMSVGLQAKLKGATQEANLEIQKVLNNNDLEEHEKKARIEAIDKALKRNLADLAMQEVALDNQIMSFESYTANWNDDIDKQLEGLKSVLKDEQLKFVKDVITQKGTMRDQTDELSAALDEMLGIIDDESKAEHDGAESTQASSKLALQKIQMDLSQKSVQHEKAAEAAMSFAKLAEVQAKDEADQITESVGATEGQLASADKQIHAADDKANHEMDEERTARETAIEEQRQFAALQSKQLLDKIKGIASRMAQVSGTTNDSQDSLLRRMDVILEVLQANAEKTQHTSEDAVAKIRANEADAERTAEEALRWEQQFQNKLNGREADQVQRLGALEASQKGLVDASMVAMGNIDSSAQGGIIKQLKKADQARSKTEGAATTEINGALAGVGSYMNETKAAIAMGLEKERAIADAVSIDAPAKLAVELEKDAEEHKRLTDLTTRVNKAKRRISNLEEIVESKLKTSNDDAEQAIGEADSQLKALERQANMGGDGGADESSLVEIRPEGSLAQLQAEVEAEEQETQQFKAKNAALKHRLESMVQQEALRAGLS